MQAESNSTSRTLSRPLVFIFVLLLAGCDIDGSDNLPDVPEAGLFMFGQVNQHEAEENAVISAAVFRDGKSINLVGGDVIEASTVTDRVLLKKKGFFKGSYAESLPVDNNMQEVIFNIVHAPSAAREDRWYPVDLLNIDPGPGELVGKTARINLPPAVTITGPVPGDEFTTINDLVDLTWVAGGMGDNMRVLSAIECTDGLATYTYGTEVEIAADDGLESIGINKFIYDLNEVKPVITFIKDVAITLLQEQLMELSAGKIDPDFLIGLADANPINSVCEIRLFLLRQRDGQFDEAFDSGNVTGSRSAEVVLYYVPSNLTNSFK